MITSEFDAGSGFASADQLQRLNEKVRNWLYQSGDRTFLDGQGVIVATVPFDTLESGAAEASELLGLTGDVNIRYTVARTEPVPGNLFEPMYHPDQTMFTYTVMDSQGLDMQVVEKENIYIGTGYAGMFGVRDKVYRNEFVHLAGSISAPRALDFIDGSIMEGRVMDVPEQYWESDDIDFDESQPITGLLSLRGVRRCMNRVKDMLRVDPKQDPYYKIRDAMGLTEDERMLEIAYDSIRISAREALALEALVSAAVPKRRRSRRLAI